MPAFQDRASEGTTRSAVASWGSTAGPWLAWGVWAGLLCVGLLLLFVGDDVVFVLPGQVVATWEVTLVVLGSAALARLLAGVVSSRTRWTLRRPLSTGAARALRAAWLGARLVAPLGLLSVLLSACSATLSGSEYTVLPPPSPDGCHVLVREESIPFSGSGATYTVAAGSMLGHKRGTYRTDDGLRPVTEGNYSLVWEGETGFLDLRGTESDPVLLFDSPVVSC